MKSILNSLSEELTSIFNKFSSSEGLVAEIALRGYVFSEVEARKVLFVGINPSYPKGSISDRFSFKPIEAVKRYPKHFKKFQDLADSCNVGTDWSYMDLLFLRETDQKKIIQLQNEKIGLDFLYQQLQLSINLIENISPDLIVVCNSGARKFFGIDKQMVNDIETAIWMGYDFIYDDKFGVDIITGIHNQSIKKGVKSTKLIGTPVLFTSTLMYMDNSSKNRLVWQIRQILKYHSLFFGLSNFQGHRSIAITKQLKTLIQKLIETQKSKEFSVTENKYEEAARFRNKELADMNEVIRLLLTMDK